MSLPFFDRSGSVHAERLKQQGRLFPLFVFEMLMSTRGRCQQSCAAVNAVRVRNFFFQQPRAFGD